MTGPTAKCGCVAHRIITDVWRRKTRTGLRGDGKWYVCNGTPPPAASPSRR